MVSTQVAGLLGVPSAEARMCIRNGRRGSLSRSVLTDGWSLVDGSAWLQASPGVERYVPHREGQPAVLDSDPELHRPGHNLANIKVALSCIDAPPGMDDLRAFSGFDVFVGYLLLDAIVANRDRHEQNWAVLRPGMGNERERLCPSFDHASSLGFQLTDEGRKKMLAQPGGLRKFAEKGTAWRFEHRGKRAATLIDLAAAGLNMCTSDASAFWRGRLQTLDLSPVLEPMNRGEIAGMPEPAATFASRLLELNVRRLSDVAFYAG